MNNKLTLSIEDALIEKAKHYAQTNKTNVSKLVSTFFASLNKNEKHQHAKISPEVKALSGIIDTKETRNLKKIKQTRLEKKYK